MYALDRKWWQVYGDEARSGFTGERFATIRVAGAATTKAQHFGNSGAATVSLAASFGARRVVMLGFDCKKAGGKAHWHPDHGGGLGNAGSIARWPSMFEKLAKQMRALSVEVVNASRETALTVFPRVRLEDALDHGNHSSPQRVADHRGHAEPLSAVV